MATRRMFGAGGERDDEDPFVGHGGGDAGFGGGDGGLSDLIGSLGPPDEGGSLMPPPSSGPVFQGADAGNTDRGRELAGPGATPNTFGLPQGVIVQPETVFNDTPEYANTFSTPMSQMEPSPVSANHMMPTTATPESGMGPQRRTSSASQIFDQGNEYGSSLFGGRSQGLEGGGLGVPGTGAGGPTPTQMMLALLQQLRGSGN